ncbi:trefoil factor 2-like [Acipenser ruthenus]|uniref:trefoil factor 2-like n=1 Tax=Acipenser ruthenus TaxID=7906 RepID=UPI00155F6CDD|nr:trefoil factor 2-like [Acipenser ruthenus]
MMFTKLLLVLLLAACVPAQVQICDVNPPDRVECGYPGISADTCRSRGCCFNSAIRGVKWCFHPKAQVCDVNPAERVECGYPGISADTCRSRGCCFDSAVSGVKWCFHPMVLPG